MVRLVKRAWIPLVMVVVMAVAAFTVSRLHGVFGSTHVRARMSATPMPSSSSTPSMFFMSFRPGRDGGRHQLLGCGRSAAAC